jgi:EmrB/QacA subfamily drug resistance transporter
MILVVMCLALVVTGLDTLIVTMALPSIRTQLGATSSQSQWIFDAYSLAYAAPILFAGALADRFGRRLGFLAGMVIFLAGSAAAALAGSPAILIGARTVMGLGAALIMPATLSLIRHVFPPEERPKAMGIWVGAASLGVPLGPVIGGLLLEKFWWGSVFLINIPVIVAAIIGCLVLIPESRNTAHPGLDIPGLLLSAIGSLLLVDGIIEGPTRGWSAALTLALITVGTAVLVAFILWERRARHPMLSHAVFADRRFGGPMITISSVFFGVFGGLYLVTQYLQITLKYRPLAAGLHLLTMCTIVLIAPLAPKLVQRFGLGPVSVLGPLLVTAALVILAVDGAPSSTRVLIALAVLGMGIGFGAPPSVDSILAATPPEQSAAGSAVGDVAMQFGGALGIALMGSLAATATTAIRPTTGWAVGAAVVGIGAVLVFAVLPRTPARISPEPAQSEQQRVAQT